jgi:uncharacterized protein involved in response to NO
LDLWRLLCWRSLAIREEFLLLILHIGYGWLVIGIALLGLPLAWPEQPTLFGVY